MTTTAIPTPLALALGGLATACASACATSWR